jgi:hypothetical protein
MKKIILLMLGATLTLSLHAQFARLDKYPQIPGQYDAAFVDYVRDFASGVAKSSYGQYFGQITRERNIYGFGAYYTDNDEVKDLFAFQYEDFTLEDYDPWPHIKAEVSV